MCAEVAVTIQGDELTDEFLFRPDSERPAHGWATEQATALCAQVRELMGPALEWADDRHRFAFLYLRSGLLAP